MQIYPIQDFMRSIIVFICFLLPMGCKTQSLITGEPAIYAVDEKTGGLVNRDATLSGAFIHKGEIVTIVLNNVFVKILQDLSNPHVLIYSEIYDEGIQVPDAAIYKILYNGENTPDNVNVGISDRILYGPVAYKGYPIQIRFFIVELDKKDKQFASDLLRAAGNAAQAAAPGYAPAVHIAVKLAEAINELNEDDFELRFDLTLFPHTQSITPDKSSSAAIQANSYHLVAPLRNGRFVILKRELEGRFASAAWTDVVSSPLLIYPYAVLWIMFPKVFPLSGSPFDAFGIYGPVTGTIDPNFDPRASRQDEFSDVAWEMSLRVRGGYLYWLIESVCKNGEVHGPAVNNDMDARQGVTVRDWQQIGDYVRPVEIWKGREIMFSERTYALLTVVSGLPLAVAEESVSVESKAAQRLMSNLLQSKGAEPLSVIDRHVEEVTTMVKGIVRLKSVANSAARMAGNVDGFRSSQSYPIYWFQHLEDPSISDDQERKARISGNRQLLDSLRDFVLNLPIVDPANPEQIRVLMNVQEDQIENVPGKSGVFKLGAAVIAALRNQSPARATAKEDVRSKGTHSSEPQASDKAKATSEGSSAGEERGSAEQKASSEEKATAEGAPPSRRKASTEPEASEKAKAPSEVNGNSEGSPSVEQKASTEGKADAAAAKDKPPSEPGGSKAEGDQSRGPQLGRETSRREEGLCRGGQPLKVDPRRNLSCPLSLRALRNRKIESAQWRGPELGRGLAGGLWRDEGRRGGLLLSSLGYQDTWEPGRPRAGVVVAKDSSSLRPSPFSLGC